MKVYIGAIILTVFGYTANGQSYKDSIPPDNYYLEKKENQSKILLKPIEIKSAYDSNTIIVIDKNIYRSGSQNFKKYSLKNLTLLEKIIDSSSVSGIKTILIYKTTNKL